MGNINTAPPAALIAGIFYADRDVLARVMTELEASYGPVKYESPEFPIDMTTYYESEMGPELYKRFVCFERPFDLDEFAPVKVFTNELESKYALYTEEGMKRRINIDPGYLIMSKLVLASTKNFSHRIYIGNGIFCEITLSFYRGFFKPHATTFPDYQTPLALEFFTKVRGYVKRNRDLWTSSNA